MIRWPLDWRSSLTPPGQEAEDLTTTVGRAISLAGVGLRPRPSPHSGLLHRARPPGLFVATGSPALPLARAVGWLWRLGDPASSPSPGAVGIGTIDEGETLGELVAANRLAAAAILCPEPGGEVGWIPARRTITGVCRFPGIGAIEEPFTVFGSGRAAVRSDRGIHAVRNGRLLAIGGGSDSWGRLSIAVLLEALSAFLIEVSGHPLVTLPAVGVLRLDDFPGTAQQQLEKQAKGDRRQARRMRRFRRAFRGSGSVLNVAACARALDDGAVVPLDQVWPDAVGELRRGEQEGSVEPVCHGFLHLDPDAHARGEVEFREFARLDRAETERRVAATLSWQEKQIGRPATFVAPAWSYGDFALKVSAALGLAPWLKPEPGPLLEGTALRETLIDGPPGLHHLDYGPLAALARLGLPPTIVMHGALLDNRVDSLRRPRNLFALARLAARRDIVRLPEVPGLRWIGAAEYARLMRLHASSSRPG